MLPIYLDHNATTPMDPRVLEVMTPWFLTPSNAGSRTHVYGQRAKDAVENARRQIADLIGAKPEEIFFTSGATESNNIAILGLQQYAERTGRRHIISTMIEHKAVLEPLERMKQLGFEVDALKTLHCDMMSISGHKIYGPQGIGALYVRRNGAQKRPVEPLLYGGGQERGLRPGTVPVALAVGFGEAARLAGLEWKQRRATAEKTRAELLLALEMVEHQINGDVTRSQPHVLNVSFPGIDSEALMLSLRDQIAISNGSACTSSSYTTSHVLMAMSSRHDRIDQTIRISFETRHACDWIPELLSGVALLSWCESYESPKVSSCR